MEHLSNTSLLPYNSFKFDAIAENLVVINNLDELLYFLSLQLSPIHIIGGGSNILLTSDDLRGYTIVNKIKGREVVYEDKDSIKIRFGAGENWHESIQWLIENNYGGLENLSLIPGSIGAAPMQNIGAYGVEQCDCFDHLIAIDLASKEKLVFYNSDCAFGYRESVFKNKLKDQLIIVGVCYSLTKIKHNINKNYGIISSLLDEKNIDNPTIKDISDTVIEIRKSKLPDPNLLGNAGSFFKNSIINRQHYNDLVVQYPTIPHYDTDDPNMVKIPTAWLIESCGFKGKIYGNVGVHNQQALVLVHYGNGKGKEVLELANMIIDAVQSKFNIQITPEVNIW